MHVTKPHFIKRGWENDGEKLNTSQSQADFHSVARGEIEDGMTLDVSLCLLNKEKQSVLSYVYNKC